MRFVAAKPLRRIASSQGKRHAGDAKGNLREAAKGGYRRGNAGEECREDRFEKPKHRAAGYKRGSRSDFTPNLKRGLQRMERSLDMCEEELPFSTFEEVLKDERRVRKLERFHREEGKRCKSDIVAEFASRLRECKSFEECKEIHEEIRDKDITSTYLGNLLVQTYSNYGDEGFQQARKEFSKITYKNVYSYNLMLKACAQQGKDLLVKKLFVKMQKRRIEPDGFTLSTTIGVYAKTGHLKPVRRVFDRLECKGVPTWTAMIAAYSQTGRWKKALKLLQTMQLEGVQPNMLTLASAVEGCKNLKVGKEIHERALASGGRLDLHMESALISMYSRCGNLQEARSVFDKMQRRTMAAWTSIIRGYARHDSEEEALQLFKRMQKSPFSPNSAVYVSVLDACSRTKNIAEGKKIHAKVIEDLGSNLDGKVKAALLKMYLRSNEPDAMKDAREIFEKMECKKEPAIWNTMIAGYIRKGLVPEAGDLYLQMKATPDTETYTTLIAACIDKKLLQDGKKLYLTRETVDASLVGMYGRSGFLESARKVFERMRKKYAEAWNCMISAYNQQGRGAESLEVYHGMLLKGVRPNEATLAAVLKACSYAGREARGVDYFRSMVGDYKLAPDQTHYHLMVELLGREGKLEEAEKLISSTPCSQSAEAWVSLVSACKAFKDVGRARRAADKAVELRPDDLSPYVLLTSVGKAAGSPEVVERTEGDLQVKLVVKDPIKREQACPT